MYLDLHEIIEVPGRSVSFTCELNPERLSFPALVAFQEPVTAEGTVKNTAGVLELNAILRSRMSVLCDLCGTEFTMGEVRKAHAILTEGDAESDDEDVFLLEGDGVDVSEILETIFVLNTELRYLCRPNCAGLCPGCGANLNEGPCTCKKQIDPRMAVLGQLLDTEE